MKIENTLKNSIHEKDGIYYIHGQKQFDYSDGGKIEDYILEVISRATDISSSSRELEKNIKDWPSLYHLSRKRSLAYQSLKIPSTARVLEVGCGCGSITRYLGEQAAAVLALEGSPRRAKITRMRTRDLKTVKVLCASFEDVDFCENFDIVVCNGVLEYAALFVDQENPHRHMLKLLSKLVAAGGSLIVAIENKFGARYFSSSKEEHTGVMFDGLEGYPRNPNGVHTFGVKELQNMFNGVFSSVEILLPLPDYKLPTAIIRAELLENVDCKELFANITRHNSITHVRPAMHERLVWSELQNNDLMLEFSNSLIMIAGDQQSTLLKTGWMGDIYSIQRKPKWTVKTEIRANADKSFQTIKSYLNHQVARDDKEPVMHLLVESAWSNGTSLHTNIVRALMLNERLSLEERLRQPISKWWKEIKSDASENGFLNGRVLDYNWQNTLIDAGTIKFIDGEWIWRKNIDPAWLIYRVAARFVSDEIFYIHRWNSSCRSISCYTLMKVVAKIVGIGMNVKLLYRAVIRENKLQKMVCGKKFSNLKMMENALMPVNIRQSRHLLKVFVDKAFGRIGQWQKQAIDRYR